MCYAVVNIDYTNKDADNNPAVRQMYDFVVPSLVLAEMLIENMFIDFQEGHVTDAEQLTVFDYPIVAVNVHDGEVTWFNDQPIPEHVQGDWTKERVFDAVAAEAHHIVPRLSESSAVVASGVMTAEDVHSAYLKFMENPEGFADLFADMSQVISEVDQDDPDALLSALESFLASTPNGADPSSETGTDGPSDVSDTTPAPKGLKMRGEQ